MLSTWENQYHPRHKHLEIKAKRAYVKLNRWWIYYRYSGNPQANAYLLTSRPKNVPFISLRNEEYSEFISNKEYVNLNWNNFWNQSPQYQAERVYPKRNRAPLRDISGLNQKINAPKRKSKLKTNHQMLYSDQNKENFYGTEKVSEKDFINKSQSDRYLISAEDWNDYGSLDSFERNLLESTRTTYNGAAKMLPFSQSKHSERDFRTPSTESYSSTYQKKCNTVLNAEPLIESKLHVVSTDENDNNLFETNMENSTLFRCDPFMDNKRIQRKTKFRALGFDGDRVAIRNQINLTGVRGWLTNNVIRPETRSTFDNKMTLDSHPVMPFRDIPLIQRHDFFHREKKESKLKSLKPQAFNLEEVREKQVKAYVRPEKIKREQKKASKKGVPKSRGSLNTIEVAHSVFSKIKSDAKDFVKSSLVEDSSKEINHIVQVAKKENHHNWWKFFNNDKETKKAPLGRDFNGSNRTLTLQTIMMLENKKRKKTVTIKTPEKLTSYSQSNEKLLIEEIDAKDTKPKDEADVSDSFTDEFDIFECYEDYSEAG